MPKYVVSDSQDETQRALDPAGTNATVSFNKSETMPSRRKSRRRAVIIVLVALCCIAVLLLCAWFVYSVFIRTTPEWQSDAFMIESIPGWRYGPKEPDDSANTLISFNSDSPQSYKKWTNVIEDFLSEYTNTRRHANNVVLCDYDRFPRPGSVCIPEYKDWFPCTKENNFGFDKSSPCVFIRFNKITNWTPVYYNNSSELPADMPENLKQAIKGYYSTYRNLMKTVWLSCEGETPADVENAGPIMYIPSLGFPGYYFPHNNTKNYVSPMVAIHFERPRTGVLINIECRVWAPNIEYNQEKGRGFVHFELMIN